VSLHSISEAFSREGDKKSDKISFEAKAAGRDGLLNWPRIRHLRRLDVCRNESTTVPLECDRQQRRGLRFRACLKIGKDPFEFSDTLLGISGGTYLFAFFSMAWISAHEGARQR
jgi:hypothetical protein